jgi:hypothetical protein
MKMIRLIFTVFVFLFISASAFAQSNEQKVIPTEGGKYVSCGHDHDGQPCGSYTFVPDEVTDVQASPAGPTGGCTQRKLRRIFVYDEFLLSQNYTHQEVVAGVITTEARNRFALDSSGVENYLGAVIVKIMPYKLPTYTTIFELQNWLNNPNDGFLDSLYIIKNELLDADQLILVTRAGLSGSAGKGVNLQLTTLPGASPEDFLNILWKSNFGVVNFGTILPGLTSTVAHELGHGLGSPHEVVVGAPSYSQAYVNDTKKVNCLMKGSRVESETYNRFSGPNSKIIKNGETIVLCADTSIHNAAKHISECLDRIWCATENHVTRVSIQPTTCGSGTLHAITNNADTFQWKVISGDCSLGATSGKDVSYVANATATIQVIGWKTGKWYADTAYITVSGIQRTDQPMTECVGKVITLPNGNPYIVSKDTTMEYMVMDTITGCEMVIVVAIKAKPTSVSSQTVKIKQGETFTLPDGKKVNASGTYISKLTNQWGCDSTITTVLTVTTATVNPEVLGLRIYPNPVQDNLFIDGLLATDQVTVHDVIGKKQSIMLHENKIYLGTLPSGIYVLTLQRGDDIAVWKVLKL